MESYLKELVEKAINSALSEENILAFNKIFEFYKDKGILDSTQSALFGMVFTMALYTFVENTPLLRKGRARERMEAFKILIETKAMKIVKRIMRTLNL